MKTRVMNQNGPPARASTGRCLPGALLALGLCTSVSLAQQADPRGAAEPAARSARAGPSQSEARLPPGQRMLRHVLRDAFPRPAKTVHRPQPSSQPFATGAAIPARNSIGSRVTTPPTGPVDPAHNRPPGMPLVPNATTASLPPANNGSLAGPSRNAAPPPPPAANRLRPAGIDGTALVRNGTAPAGIGGPARSTTGINGTNVRPKHQQ